MRTSPRRVAVAVMIAVAGGMLLPVPAADATVNPSRSRAMESVHRMDPLMGVNCMTATGNSTTADPTGAVAVPPEVPLAGCLTF